MCPLFVYARRVQVMLCFDGMCITLDMKILRVARCQKLQLSKQYNLHSVSIIILTMSTWLSSRKRVRSQAPDASSAKKRPSPFVVDSENYKVKVMLSDATFLVERNTLLRRDGFLACKFGDRWSGKKHEVFIDGDGKVFKEVLCYLRDPDNFCPPAEHCLKADLYSMADKLCMAELASLVRPLSIFKVDGFFKTKTEESWALAWKRMETCRAYLRLPTQSFNIKFMFSEWDLGVKLSKGYSVAFNGETRCKHIVYEKYHRLWHPGDSFDITLTPFRAISILSKTPFEHEHETLLVKEIPPDAHEVMVWPERNIAFELLKEEDKTMEALVLIAHCPSDRCRIFDTGFQAIMPDGSVCYGLTEWREEFGYRCKPLFMATFSSVGEGHLVDVENGIRSVVVSRRPTFLHVDVRAGDDSRFVDNCFVRCDVDTTTKDWDDAIMTLEGADEVGCMTVKTLENVDIFSSRPDDSETEY